MPGRMKKAASQETGRQAGGTGRMRRIEYFPVPPNCSTDRPLRCCHSESCAIPSDWLPAPPPPPCRLWLWPVTLLTFGIILILLLDATSCEKLSYLHRLLLSSSLELPLGGRRSCRPPPFPYLPLLRVIAVAPKSEKCCTLCGCRDLRL